MQNRYRLFAGLICVAGPLSAGAATLTTYTDPTLFATVVPVVATEGFSMLSGSATPAAGVALNPGDSPITFETLSLTITGGDDSFGDGGVFGSPSSASGFEIDISLFVGEHSSYVFTFPEAVTAFAFNVESPFSTDGFTLALAGEVFDTSPFFAAGGGQGVQFLGVTSDTPFTTVTFGGGEELFFAFDFQYGNVPEPASVALLAGGLALLATRRRRA